MAEFRAIGPIDDVYEVAKFLENRRSTFADMHVKKDPNSVFLKGADTFNTNAFRQEISQYLAIFSDEWTLKVPSVRRFTDKDGNTHFALRFRGGPCLYWIIRFSKSRKLALSEIWYKQWFLISDEIVVDPPHAMKMAFSEMRKYFQKLNYRYLTLFGKGGTRYLIHKPLQEDMILLYKEFHPSFGEAVEPKKDWYK